MPVLFVTGSSTGFGRRLCEAGLRRGYDVVATARRPEALDGLPEGSGGSVLRLALDVTDEASVAAAFEAARARFGRVDVVVNNAGYGTGGAIEEFTDDEIRRQYETNVFGAIRVIRHALPILRAQGSGHILNVTSVAGIRARPAFGIYASTKFALEAIGEALALEVAPFGIRVTNVEPGAFRTDFGGRSFARAANATGLYRQTVGANLDWLEGVDGRQIGDAAKAAEAMLDLVEMPDPPVHLPLGRDALAGIRTKLAALAADVDRMEAVALSTDHEDGGGGI